ncbi:unnamed protein product [Ectocarpus sp. 4 AP-2014]
MTVFIEQSYHSCGGGAGLASKGVGEVRANGRRLNCFRVFHQRACLALFCRNGPPRQCLSTRGCAVGVTVYSFAVKDCNACAGEGVCPGFGSFDISRFWYIFVNCDECVEVPQRVVQNLSQLVGRFHGWHPMNRDGCASMTTCVFVVL